MARVAIVTGGTRGIGEAISVALRDMGMQVAANYAGNEERAREFSDRTGIAAYKWDVADFDACQEGVKKVEGDLGPIDVLVNNAGGGRMIDITEETPEQHHHVLDVNLTGVWAGIRAVVPAMKAAGRGSIINISSIDGLVGVAQMASYVASKFAVTGLTRSLALELGEHGIRINSVHPGITRTPILPAGPLNPRLQKAIDRQPIKRIGQPQDIANAVLFFASDESDYCTGSSLVVDGGHIAGPYRDSISG